MDWPLLINALALCAVGLLNVYSGTRVHGVPGTVLVTKQLVWTLLGIAAFFAVYLTSDGFIEETAYGFYIAVLFLLVVVLLAGQVRGGAQRWIAIGAFNFQPSEFAKIAVTLALARYLSGMYRYGGIGLREVLPAIGLVLAPFLLVALQPDLGSAGVFLFILAGMVVVACVRWKVLAFFAAGGAAAIPALSPPPLVPHEGLPAAAGAHLLEPRARPPGRGVPRDPVEDRGGLRGIIGKGYLQGTQGSLRFLPEQHTDFAFAVFSEEWGFLGSLLLLVLFLLLVYRLFFLTVRSQDRFASFACGGFAVFFLTHIVINLAMVCGLFPVVGIPLPFVSYGGSSMLTNMMALGVAANLSRSRFTFQGGGGKGRGISS